MKLVLDEKVFPIAYEVIQAKAVLKELEEEARRAAALKLLLEKLREAIRKRELEPLESALEDVMKAGADEKEPTVVEARLLILFLKSVLRNKPRSISSLFVSKE